MTGSEMTQNGYDCYNTTFFYRLNYMFWGFLQGHSSRSSDPAKKPKIYNSISTSFDSLSFSRLNRNKLKNVKSTFWAHES